MSLVAAVEEIAETLEKDAEGEQLTLEVRSLLRGHARSLRLALKAVAGEPQSPAADPFLAGVDASTRRLAEMAATRLERGLKREDAADLGRWVPCVGGRADGTHFTLVGVVPEGAWVPVCGQAYQFRGGQLHYDETETRRLAAQAPLT